MYSRNLQHTIPDRVHSIDHQPQDAVSQGHSSSSDSTTDRDNPFASTLDNPFVGVNETPDDQLLTIPTIPGPQPRRPVFRGSPSTSSRPYNSRSNSRVATPSNGRYLSPYATPRASRRSSIASPRISLSTNTSTQDLFWSARKDEPYGYEHEADSSIDLNTQTVTEKFDIGPTTNLLWDPSYVEDDDDLHNPDIDNPKRDTNIWTKRGVTNLGGLILVIVGLLCIFIVVPLLTWQFDTHTSACEGDSCLDVGARALLRKPRTSLIDADTPASALTKTDASGKKLKLVFSDEFNQDGRTFYPGDDQFFEAKDLWYWPTQDLEWYDPDAVTTKGGYLELRMDAFPNHDLNYRSGMIQSWNMLCFKGGLIEVSVELPGAGSSSGLWPAIWTMGNLGRAGYGATTDGMWPYSYQACDSGITPNQSRSDGLSWLPGMRLPSCLCDSTQAPGSVKHARSAPEIDIFEASVGQFSDGTTNGIVSQSYQIGPFDDFYQPNYEFAEIYNSSVTSLNSYTGGPYQQALSGVTALNNQWYQYPAASGGKFQTYAFGYTPGSTSASNIQWYVGGEPVWKMTAPIIGATGNIGARTISEEPMAIVMNLALSQSFAYIDWESLKFPSVMKIDYVRIYQTGTSSVTCDPAGWETTEYIANHPKAYTNKDVTSWESAGYTKPANRLMNNC